MTNSYLPPSRTSPSHGVRAALLTLLALLAPPLGGALAQGAEPAPLRVVATVGMLADVAGEVGGDCVEVEALMGPGVDPHLYNATASDVRTLQQAEVVLYGGFRLEGQLGEVLERFGRQKPVVAVAEAAVAAAGTEGALLAGPYEGSPDPHLWMDVSMWAPTAAVIADVVAEARPDCAEAARANAEGYRAQLDALHAWIGEAVATVPERQRVLVTAHDAFAYFGRAYGVEVAGIQGISTEAEAGIADIRGVVDLVVEREVPAVFVESTINPRTVNAVIEAAGERGQEVAIGAQLYSDAMGEPGTPDGTYLGMLLANTRAIVGALGGTPPPLPDALAPWAERWGEGAP